MWGVLGAASARLDTQGGNVRCLRSEVCNLVLRRYLYHEKLKRRGGVVTSFVIGVTLSLRSILMLVKGVPREGDTETRSHS